MGSRAHPTRKHRAIHWTGPIHSHPHRPKALSLLGRACRAIEHTTAKIRPIVYPIGIAVVILVTACSTYPNTKTLPALIQAPDIRAALDLGEPKPNQKAIEYKTIKALVLGIDTNTQLPFEQRVVLKQTNGKIHHLLLKMPSNLAMPFGSGERLTVHIVQRWHEGANRLIQAFHIQGGMKDTRFLLQQDRMLSKQHIPPEVSVSTGKEVVYTESRRVDGMCFATTEHRKLILEIDGTPAEVSPGGLIQLHLQSGKYQWMAIDNRITLDSNCDKHSDDRMSWILVQVNES